MGVVGAASLLNTEASLPSALQKPNLLPIHVNSWNDQTLTALKKFTFHSNFHHLLSPYTKQVNMKNNILTTLVFGLLAFFVAAFSNTDDATSLCIKGCCGLKLSLESNLLTLQSQTDTTTTITVPLSSKNLVCCPCPASVPADTSMPEPADVPAGDEKPLK
jgi:hypothetical protein